MMAAVGRADTAAAAPDHVASPAAVEQTSPPSAYTMCYFGGVVLGQTNPTVAYADYDLLRYDFLRAACWTRDGVPPYVSCTFYVYQWNPIYYPNTSPTVVTTGGGCHP